MRRIISLAFALTIGASPLTADTMAGPYLAATHADRMADFTVAGEYYTEALAQDPENFFLIQNALYTRIAAGDLDGATEYARRLLESEGPKELAVLHIISMAMRDNDFGRANTILAENRLELNALVRALVTGWITAANGGVEEAQAQFNEMSTNPIMRFYGRFHEGLIRAMVGDYEGADAAFTNGEGDASTIHRGGLIIRATVLSQIDRGDEAIALLQDALANGAQDEEVSALLARLEAGETIPFNQIRTAKDGLAEAFYDVALALDGDGASRLSLVYARYAQALAAEKIDYALLTADLLDSLGQYDLASAALAEMPEDSPRAMEVGLARADILAAGERDEEALALLVDLRNRFSDELLVHSKLGDLYHSMERYEEANAAYGEAIARINGEPRNAHWVLFYQRGAVREQLRQFEGSEADLRQALELEPGQPIVLNHLGYSLVEQGRLVEEAQQMIEEAVAADPQNAYIIDSLAWVRYRLGEYEAAVEPMEEAISLMPEDVTLNDHLGDIYARVGRMREARVQWQRALSLEPDEEMATRIREKLDEGIEALDRQDAQ
ncbi:tetratricopeptide repeat protein [Paracoccaceae bacterium GXU_MW_L88]